MSKIANIRTILISGKYGTKNHPEILECFPNGPKRSIGIVEVTLENGIKGSRLKARAYGEEEPSYPNIPHTERKKNRRVILSIDMDL